MNNEQKCYATVIFLVEQHQLHLSQKGDTEINNINRNIDLSITGLGLYRTNK